MTLGDTSQHTTHSTHEGKVTPMCAVCCAMCAVVSPGLKPGGTPRAPPRGTCRAWESAPAPPVAVPEPPAPAAPPVAVPEPPPAAPVPAPVLPPAAAEPVLIHDPENRLHSVEALLKERQRAFMELVTTTETLRMKVARLEEIIEERDRELTRLRVLRAS